MATCKDVSTFRRSEVWDNFKFSWDYFKFACYW